jgi:hypothetical protein
MRGLARPHLLNVATAVVEAVELLSYRVLALVRLANEASALLLELSDGRREGGIKLLGQAGGLTL